MSLDKGWVREWVNARVEGMLQAFGVPHWRVRISYEPLDGATGECTTHEEYERAYIALDPAKIDDEERLREVLEHEILHVVEAPYTSFYRAVEALDLPPQVHNLLAETWRQARERGVRNMERLVRCLREAQEEQEEADAQTGAPDQP